MEEYFTETNERFKSGNYHGLTVVLGNESCDLDSVVSALGYAIFLNWQYKQLQCKVCTRNKRDETTYKPEIFVAVLNVNREDFDLKTEVAFALKQHNVDNSQLIFIDDINLQELSKQPHFKAVLVDHHVLATKDKWLAPHVTEIIDHRPIDKQDWPYADDTRCTIESVGSCATLVTRRAIDLSDLMSQSDSFFRRYAQCSHLLRSTILLDTVNFCKKLDKTTPIDVEMVEFLEKILEINDKDGDRQGVVDALVAARSDVSTLTAAQLLRKDVKVFGQVFTPSFPILVENFLQRPSALEAVSGALAARRCRLAVLLGMDLQGGLRRDVAIYSDEPGLTEQFSRHIEAWSPSFQLTSEEKAKCRYYKQMNLKATRKQYVPAVNAFVIN